MASIYWRLVVLLANILNIRAETKAQNKLHDKAVSG